MIASPNNSLRLQQPMPIVRLTFHAIWIKTWARQWPGRRSPQWSRSANETHCCQSVSSRVYHANAIWNAICLVAQQNKIWIDSDFILIYLCFVYRSCLEERDGANNSSEKFCHLQPLVKFSPFLISEKKYLEILSAPQAMLNARLNSEQQLLSIRSLECTRLQRRYQHMCLDSKCWHTLSPQWVWLTWWLLRKIWEKGNLLLGETIFYPPHPHPPNL